jgi:hypothetical protein
MSDDAAYAAFLAREQPESDEESESRRVRALEDALAAFPEVNAKVREVYGFELPRTVFVFDAFWRSLSTAEREAYEDLDLPRPAGVLEYFAPGGLARRTRSGLDPRLHWRFRSDPPELVTVLLGTGDGEHFGLFYDDPAKLPAGVAVNYARDSAETWWCAPTLLGVLDERLDRIEEESLEADYFEDVTRAACQVRLLREAIASFADVEAEAEEADAERQIMSYEERTKVPSISCGVGVVVRGLAAPLPYVAQSPFSGDEARLRAFVAEARAALDRGEPAFALGLGRDLHWADQDDLRAETKELLTRAYRMLGREALARIVEVHHAHRDLRMVTVFEDDP